MKPAEEFEPEELFAIEEATADIPQYPSSFPVDMALQINDISSVHSNTISSRLTAGYSMTTDSSSAQQGPYTGMPEGWQHNKGWGWRNGAGVASPTDVAWMFRRAPGFFDVVTYVGDGQAGREVPHNLAAVPEIIWFKQTSGGGNWLVYTESLGVTDQIVLNKDAAPQAFDILNGVAPTSEVITTGAGDPNANTGRYIAYLWASVPGICDIGTYTGNGQGPWSSGTSLQIDCGFTNGARFVLVKRTDAGGNWMYFDTLRGSQSTLALNLTDAQVVAQYGTDAPWPQYAPGFAVVGYNFDSAAYNPNIDGAEYIYMAIA
jgi:hypothetical protein